MFPFQDIDVEKDINSNNCLTRMVYLKIASFLYNFLFKFAFND